jgi:membrane fusion protein (multidrug efflux system)
VKAAQAGIARSEHDQEQAEARYAGSQTAISAAEARLAQSKAQVEEARGKIIEAQAGVGTAQADAKAAAAVITGSAAKEGVAKAQEQRARAALTEASTVKGYTTIRASSSGVVTARLIAPGVLVQPGMAIARLAKLDYVRLQASVSQADLVQLRVGQQVNVRPLDEGVMPFKADLTAVFPAQDPTSRTALVEARVPNPGQKLRPGQYLALDLNLGGPATPVLSVPVAAVLTRDETASVFVVQRDGPQPTLRRVEIRLGRASNTRIEVLGGLAPGDEVVTSGISALHDGDAVTIIPASPAPSTAPVSGKEADRAGG